MEQDRAATLMDAFAKGISFGRCRALGMDEPQWISVHPNGPEHKGQPVLLESTTGEVLGGMGGKFTGRHISAAKGNGKFEQHGAQMVITRANPKQHAAALNGQKIDFKQVEAATKGPEPEQPAPQPEAAKPEEPKAQAVPAASAGAATVAEQAKEIEGEVNAEKKRVKAEAAKYHHADGLRAKKAWDTETKRAMAGDKTLAPQKYSAAITGLEQAIDRMEAFDDENPKLEDAKKCLAQVKEQFAKRVASTPLYMYDEAMSDRVDGFLSHLVIGSAEAEEGQRKEFDGICKELMKRARDAGNYDAAVEVAKLHASAVNGNNKDMRKALNAFTDAHADDFGMPLQSWNMADWKRQKELAKKAHREAHPAAIAGAKAGAPMEFKDANGKRANPDFKSNPDAHENCQTCVLAFKARREGYDVEAMPYGSETQTKLARNTTMAYINRETGEFPREHKFKKLGQALNTLEAMAKEGELYNFAFSWKQKKSGHIINAFKQGDELYLYDPQNGELLTKRGFRSAYGAEIAVGNNSFMSWDKTVKTTLSRAPRFYRTDNCDFNMDIAEQVLKGAKHED